MAVFHGIQVYEILDNGNLLQAVYTNNGLANTTGYGIDSEIARKITYDNNGVEGSYNCRYIETINSSSSVTSCVLEIKKVNGVYEFFWRQGSKLIWEGLGLMAGTSHISVSYVNP